MALWFEEIHREGWKQSYLATEKLFDKQSPYQHVEVYKTEMLGNLMALDGCAMLSQADEFVYHEMIAHVPLCVHPAPKKALIIGGGDGGTAREALKHAGLEIDMVEIDQMVIDASKAHFPEFDGVWDHERFHLTVGDGLEFVRTAADKTYDIVFVDSTDPEGPAKGLFDKAFYAHVYRILKEDGICVAQGESWAMDMEIHKEIIGVMGEFFRFAIPYKYDMQVYPGSPWNFIFASKKYHPTADLKLHKADMLEGLKYYNGDIHTAAFAMPNYVYEELKAVLKL